MARKRDRLTQTQKEAKRIERRIERLKERHEETVSLLTERHEEKLQTLELQLEALNKK